MADELITTSVTLAVTECPTCFTEHAIPRRMYRDRLANGGSVYCPNGHPWVFCEPENDKLKRQLEQSRRIRDSLSASLTAERDQRLAAQRSAAARLGQLTKLRNRVGNGVCPCCNRSFANLARHMDSQHPDFRDDLS